MEVTIRMLTSKINGIMSLHRRQDKKQKRREIDKNTTSVIAQWFQPMSCLIPVELPSFAMTSVLILSILKMNHQSSGKFLSELDMIIFPSMVNVLAQTILCFSPNALIALILKSFIFLQIVQCLNAFKKMILGILQIV